MNRRIFMLGSIAVAGGARSADRVVRSELIPVRATHRTVWLFVRLTTRDGAQGLGEASDAFGFGDTTKEQALRMESELKAFQEIAAEATPAGIAAYLEKGKERARAGGLAAATAYSATEQALWDLAGQVANRPVHSLLGRKRRSEMAVYANINRSVTARTPDGFAEAARRAAESGFDAFKLAPFDGFPPKGSAEADIRKHVENGIAAIFAVREAVGGRRKVMVDCHSFFDVPLSKDVARRLEPARLDWYEEPVAPERVAETVEIRQGIKQRMAGGEMLFGVAGFTPLCARKAVHVIMPDVKHCGGLRELTRIAVMAAKHGVEVSPHNPAGPVSTIATIHTAAVLPRLSIIEHQYGEVPWRGDLLHPPERFERGRAVVPETPGLGVRLNEELARRYAL